MITLDKVTNNLNGTVKVESHDDGGNYINIIGLVSSPTPDDPASQKNMDYYTAYVESAIPPTPTVIFGS